MVALSKDAHVEIKTTSGALNRSTPPLNPLECQGSPTLSAHPLPSSNSSTPPLTSTKTSSPFLSSFSASLTPQFEANNKVYERKMLEKCRGYPLWVPECSQTLLVSKRKLGVDVGDVGLIENDGHFVFLFNILLPSDHSFHPDVMPEGYTPVQPLRPHDMMLTNPLATNTAMTSAGVRRLRLNDASTRDGQNFEIIAPQGVILALPDGMQSSDVQTVSIWIKYISSNIESWYRYVMVTLGYHVRNGDIRLVTGCDKSSS
ncbi:hypothetical protein BJ165DRAFT_1067886 [Panaeolus papilionaceus]|nr:hypothetical protein BJ165DRAFT_1067886 [Panaeolus papilionaceus]